MTKNHALVFGASGVAGWGVVEQLLEDYPIKGTFSTTTALVNRPLTFEESRWPGPSPDRPELDIVSGIDLTEGSPEDFAAVLKSKVKGIAEITHVYYYAYKPDEPEKEVSTNVQMLERVVFALKKLSPNLKFIVFPSGSKAYGAVLVPGGYFKAPYDETMVLPDEENKKIFYWEFQKLLSRESEKEAWTWCDIRPDAVIGFVPNGSQYNLTAHWANYLSAYALLEGKSSQVPFPGTPAVYKGKYNEASSTMIGRISIWASLNPQKSSEQTFNIADQAKGESMQERWPALCSYFGLEGVPPSGSRDALLPGAYVKAHRHELQKRGMKGTEVFKAEFLDNYGFIFDFDRQFSLQKARRAGFVDEVDPNQSWFTAFDRFKAAGVLL
ncbi:hypothetical protein BP5796_11807 [Coleophoma crateriformis]|uniref:PRISE-like Rossmann-fold domain-containing protein n=1 Tax=Coleophoma crateriformis TaxID=565419 RepID=A0A3D8QES0_9HELO|nr:hypothetical protein BP5796_11807 [Coleophoma crateriformis]